MVGSLELVYIAASLSKNRVPPFQQVLQLSLATTQARLSVFFYLNCERETELNDIMVVGSHSKKWLHMSNICVSSHYKSRYTFAPDYGTSTLSKKRGPV